MIHILHTWSKWRDRENEKVGYRRFYNGKFLGFYKEQEKTCTVCGKKKLREVRS